MIEWEQGRVQSGNGDGAAGGEEVRVVRLQSGEGQEHVSLGAYGVQPGLCQKKAQAGVCGSLIKLACAVGLLK